MSSEIIRLLENGISAMKPARRKFRVPRAMTQPRVRRSELLLSAEQRP